MNFLGYLWLKQISCEHLLHLWAFNANKASTGIQDFTDICGADFGHCNMLSCEGSAELATDCLWMENHILQSVFGRLLSKCNLIQLCYWSDEVTSFTVVCYCETSVTCYIYFSKVTYLLCCLFYWDISSQSLSKWKFQGVLFFHINLASYKFETVFVDANTTVVLFHSRRAFKLRDEEWCKCTFCRHCIFPSAVTWSSSFHNLLCVVLSTDAGHGEFCVLIKSYQSCDFLVPLHAVVSTCMLRYDRWFGLKNWQTSCQFNFTRKLKKLKMFQIELKKVKK